MVASIQLCRTLFLLTLEGSVTAGVDSSTHRASVVRHDNLGHMSTVVGSTASSLLPQQTTVLRRDDVATSQERSSLSEDQQAPVNPATAKQAGSAKVDPNEVKLREDDVKKAEETLELAKKRLATEVHKQLIQKLRKYPPKPLPEGWKSTKDPKSGRLYYYKKDKDGYKVQWERPSASPASGLASKQTQPAGGNAATVAAPVIETDSPRDPNLPHPPNEQLPPSLSAYEKDYYNDLSEYFGPFRLDYSKHNIELPDWNMVVESPEEIPGRGNLIIGNENYGADADNAFIMGKHNTARGFAVTAAGGKDNVAEGNGVVVVGGEQNVARGNFSVVNGGYRNEVSGSSYAMVGGGVKNVAVGDFGSVTGGQSNLAEGYAAVVTGGKSNEALGKYSAVHGGSGNKALGNSSVVGGGLGQTAEGDGDTVFQELTRQDLETLASADHVGNPFER